MKKAGTFIFRIITIGVLIVFVALVATLIYLTITQVSNNGTYASDVWSLFSNMAMFVAGTIVGAVAVFTGQGEKEEMKPMVIEHQEAPKTKEEQVLEMLKTINEK